MDSRYSKNTSSDYEISISNDTVIQECDEDGNCPNVTYQFRKISEAGECLNGFMDLIAVIKDIKEVDTVMRKNTNKELVKREVTLVDDSNSEVNLTLWGDGATSFQAEIEDVLVAKNIKVTEFNGVSLSQSLNTIIEINAESQMDRVAELKGWYTRTKETLQITKLTNRQGVGANAPWENLFEINAENIQAENVFILQTKATINQVGKLILNFCFVN